MLRDLPNLVAVLAAYGHSKLRLPERCLRGLTTGPMTPRQLSEVLGERSIVVAVILRHLIRRNLVFAWVDVAPLRVQCRLTAEGLRLLRERTRAGSTGAGKDSR